MRNYGEPANGNRSLLSAPNTKQFDRTYYGTTSDIELAKRSGVQGKFYDVSKYGDGSKLKDILHSYKTGGNPVILGGAGATGGINDQIYRQLINSGANVQRISGKDRYEVQSNLRNYTTDLNKQKQQYLTTQQQQQLVDQSKGQVNNLYDQQKKAQLEQLKAQRDKAIGGINQQKAALKPQYAAQRNQTDAINAQNVQRLRELMAASGLTSSGENVSAQVAQNNQRQESLGALNLQEQQQTNELNSRIVDLNNPAEQNAMMAALEAERARALIDAQNRAEEMAYNRSRDMVADDRYNEEFNYRRGQDLEQKQWREHTYKNMSASEKAQLEWAKSQYGEDAAWRMFELKFNGELAKSQNQAEIDFYKNAGFNQTSGGGGSYTKKASGSPNKSYQSHMSQAVKMGVPSAWVPAMTELVGRESSWNPSAKNPKSTAHGYGQFLNSTRANYEKKTGLSYSNPVHQLVMMAQYVKDRYGTPEKALAFWDKNKWY